MEATVKLSQSYTAASLSTAIFLPASARQQHLEGSFNHCPWKIHPSTFLYIGGGKTNRMPYLRIANERNPCDPCKMEETPVILCDLSDHLLKLERWIVCGLAWLVRLWACWTKKKKKKFIKIQKQQLCSKRTEHLLWHLLLQHRPQHVVFLLQSPVGSKGWMRNRNKERKWIILT